MINFFVLLLFLACYSAYGQFANPDGIYKRHIASADVFPTNEPMLPPILELNSTQGLEFHFDDLDFDIKSYAYRIRHCNWNWETSDLQFMQYLNGFPSFEVQDFSFATGAVKQPYTHYTFQFPNDMMKPLIGGNYVAEVYLKENEEEVVWRRRFLVLDPLIKTEVSIRSGSLASNRMTHQEVVFQVNTQFLKIQDFFEDVKVVVLQNRRWDNGIYGVKPRYIEKGKLIFDHVSGELSFPGGNQYRFLDLKSLISIIDPVIGYEEKNGIFHARLRPAKPRSKGQYSNIPDINGGFRYHNQEGTLTMADPDYFQVNFLLDNGIIFDDDEVYVIGGFSHGQLQERYRMIPDHGRGFYFLSVPMKQGYYNYMFALRKKSEAFGDVSLLEGSFSQTENTYTVLVYLRQSGDIAHRLVSFSEVNSATNR
jgi:hypothetical protein